MTCIVGRSRAQASPGVAVSGVVAGLSLRSDPRQQARPWMLDVRLRSLQAWRYGEGLAPRWEWPASFRAWLRVGVAEWESLETVAQSLVGGEAADGAPASPSSRSPIVVWEMPRQRCPDCQHRLTTDVAACPACGRPAHVVARVRASYHARLPGEGEAGCRYCWAREPGEGTHCRVCGTPRDLAARCERQLEKPREVELGLEGSDGVAGVLRARLLSATARQVVPHAGPVLVARAEPLAFRTFGEEEFTTFEERFETTLLIRNEGADLPEALARLLEGERLGASEPVRPCRSCVAELADEAGQTAPAVRGRFCRRCGERGRVRTHPDAWRGRGSTRGGRAGPQHGCGAPYAPGRDRFCVACGGDLEGFRPHRGRFQKLG